MSGDNSSELFRTSSGKKLERIAYAWIHYQLKWLSGTMDDVPPPSAAGTFDDSHWDKLLAVRPEVDNDTKHGPRRSQDWPTQTLPLLARPEIGLPPEVQSQLLRSCRLE